MTLCGRLLSWTAFNESALHTTVLFFLVLSVQLNLAPTSNLTQLRSTIHNGYCSDKVTETALSVSQTRFSPTSRCLSTSINQKIVLTGKWRNITLHVKEIEGFSVCSA